MYFCYSHRINNNTKIINHRITSYRKLSKNNLIVIGIRTFIFNDETLKTLDLEIKL